MLTIKNLAVLFVRKYARNLHLPMNSEIIKIISFVQVAIAEDNSNSVTQLQIHEKIIPCQFLTQFALSKQILRLQKQIM